MLNQGPWPSFTGIPLVIKAVTAIFSLLLGPSIFDGRFRCNKLALRYLLTSYWSNVQDLGVVMTKWQIDCFSICMLSWMGNWNKQIFGLVNNTNYTPWFTDRVTDKFPYILFIILCKFPNFSNILCKIPWLFQHVQNFLDFFQVFQSMWEQCTPCWILLETSRILSLIAPGFARGALNHKLSTSNGYHFSAVIDIRN